MPKTTTAPTVAAHFVDRSPVVLATYEAVLSAARKLGRVREDPKKTSIHLVRTSAFAGIVTRKAKLILTLKADTALRSPRITKRERASAKRWHVEIPLESPDDVDREIAGWLKQAYALS
jgi:hypothetical protein